MNLNIDSDTLCNSLMLLLPFNWLQPFRFRNTQLCSYATIARARSVKTVELQLATNRAFLSWALFCLELSSFFRVTAHMKQQLCSAGLPPRKKRSSLIATTTIAMSINIPRFLFSSSLSSELFCRPTREAKRTAEIRFFPQLFLIVNWELPHHHK